MALEFRIVQVHRATDGSYEEQDITRRVISRTARQLIVSVPLRDRYDYNFRSGQELWMGFRDTLSSWWTPDESIWGGYIFGEVRKYKRGGMYVWELPILDYEVLLDTSNLRGFPLDPIYLNPYVPSPVLRKYHVPPRASDYTPGAPAMYGFIPGYNARAWLVYEAGYLGQPHDGVVPRTLQDTDLTGVDDDFALNPFDVIARPGNTPILGYMEMLDLRGMIAMILSCATLLANDPGSINLDPFYTMRAVVNEDFPNRIRPQLRVINLLSAGTPDWTYKDAADQTVNESRWWDYYEVWAARPGSTRTITQLFGLGSDFDSLDVVPPNAGYSLNRRVYAEDTTGSGNFPSTYYQRTPGWAGTPYNDDRVTKITTAAALAAVLQKSTSHERVSIHFRTYDPVRKGDIVDLSNEASTLEGVFPVVDVDWDESEGRRIFSVTCGDREPTVQDIIGGQAAQLLLMGQEGIRRSRNGDGYSFVDPRLPNTTPPDRVPMGRFQNQRQSMTDNVASDWRRTAINRIKMTPDGMTISEDDWNFIEATIGEPASNRPVAGQDTLAGPVYVAGGNAIVEWDDADGRNGPQHHTYTFRYDDFEDVILPDGAVITTAACKYTTDDTTGARVSTATYTTDGLDIVTPAASGVIVVELRYYDETLPGYVTVTPDVSPQQPLIVKFQQDLQLHISGIPAGQRAAVLISERRPDIRFYDYAPAPPP